MANSAALQALLDKYAAWTPGSGVQQLPGWQPDNLNDPSAAMFGFGAPHVYWQPPPPPPPTQSSILPPTGGRSGDQGLPGGGLAALTSGGGNYAGPPGWSDGISGAGGLGNGAGLGNGYGSMGSEPGSIGSGTAGGSRDYTDTNAYLDGLASANGLTRDDPNASSWMPSGGAIGSILGGLIGGPIGAVGGYFLGNTLGSSKLDQAVQGTMNQGAMGMQLDGGYGGTAFTPDGSDPGGGHAVDSTGFVDGAGQNNSYSNTSQSGGGGGSGWSEGGTHDTGGGQYGQVVNLSGGLELYRPQHSSLAAGGSVAQAIGGRAFGKFMSGPMQTDPRTAQFAAELKQAMTELATGLKDDPQAAKVRAFFQANYVEPVEVALRKKDAESAMRLCVAMLNEAHRIAQGEKP